MNNRSEGDGEGGRERRRPLLDPVAGMRAMAEIQADGLRAASELLERVLEPDRSGPQPRPRSQQGDYAALMDAWAELLARLAAGLERPAGSGGVRVPVDSDAAGPPLRLALEPSGQGGGEAAEIWLHNGTSAAVGPLALRCGTLTAPDGTVLEGARVSFDPAEVEQLPPRSSRGVLVSLAASGPLRPGVYRGTIQAEGAPRLWLPVEAAIGPC